MTSKQNRSRITPMICILSALFGILGLQGSLSAAIIPTTDKAFLSSLSPYNWVCKEGQINSAVNGASITLRLTGTRRIALQLDTEHFKNMVPTRLPILAWSVNGRALQIHQIVAGENELPLCTDVPNPAIELYIRGMSPFEDRYSGDVPRNSVQITGLVVDEGGSVAKSAEDKKIWLNIGDSIMSGDGAALAKGQGRPADDLWAASEDGRASYGYLLAKHFGYRESRIAYGGYDWGGGMASVPALTTLIDNKTSTVTRLDNDLLSPPPDVVLINLGENGAPGPQQVTGALTQLRHRAGPAAKIIVMIPVSGSARAQVTAAFNDYKKSASDENAFLVDLGQITYPTCDGQHPTAAGHQAIYTAALPKIEKVVQKHKTGTPASMP